jgi:hypothetical protein
MPEHRLICSISKNSSPDAHLHSVATTIAKGKDRGRKRVELHRLLHQDSKAVNAGAKVDGLAMQVDLEISA